MPAATDAVWLDVLPSMKGFGPALAKGADKEAAKAGRLAGGSFGKAALAATAVVAGGAVLASKALYNIGQTFQDVEDTIRVGTGATGAALDDLTDSAKNVGKQVPAEFDDIGTAVADLNTRLGLTGEPLEAMSAQFLELSRITGTDVASNIASMTRVFGDWDVAAEDQSETLDRLFRASQATGIGVDALADRVVQFGSPLRAMGFSLDEAAALFGKFEKEGVNAELVIGSLRQGLGRMARAGEDAPETFRRVVEEISGMESRTEATAAAMELFGARAGPDMAAAIQEGRFELGELLNMVTDGEDTILAAGEDTRTFSEQWQIFKNKVMVDLAPLAERVFGAITTGMTWIAERGIPTIRDFGRWVQRNASWLAPLAAAVGAIVAAVTAWTIVSRTFAAVQGAVNLVLAANPIGIVVLAIAGLVAALVVAYKRSETFRNVVDAAWQGVQTVVRAVVGWLTGTAWPAIKGVWDAIADAALWLWNSVLKPAWEGIRLAIAVAVEAVKLYWTTILQPTWAAVAAAARWLWNNVLSPVFGFVAAAWKLMVAGVQHYWRTILKPVWDAVSTAASWLWRNILQPIFQAIGDRWRDVLGAMKRVWDTVLKPVFSAVGTAVETMRDAVARAVDAIGRAWDGLKRVFAAPVNWVIDNVINKFLGWVNRIAGDLGLSIRLDLVPNVSWGQARPSGGTRNIGITERNKGGFIPGSGPDRDSVWLHGTPGEFVWSRRAVDNVGGANLAAMHDAARRGQPLEIGGPVGWLRDVATSALDVARRFAAVTVRPGVDAALALMDRTVGRWGMPGQLAAGAARRTGNAVLDWLAGIDEEADRRVPELAGGGFQALLDYLRATDVAHVVTSTLRPGDRGYHGRGKAADFSATGHGDRGYRDAGLRAIFDAFLPASERLAELILAGAPFNVKGGRRVPGYAWGRPGEPGNHWNHVHAAVFDEGGWLQPGVTQVANWTGRPEAVLTDQQWDRLTDQRSGSPLWGEVHFHAGADEAERLLYRARHQTRLLATEVAG